MTTPRDHRLAAPPRGLPPVNVDGRRVVHSFGRTVVVDRCVVDGVTVERVIVDEAERWRGVVERVFPPRVGDE